MGTSIGRASAAHLYMAEWREYLRLTLDQVAGRVGVARNTIWRWENEQKRLDPYKTKAYADALGIEPEDLWHYPPQRSIDGMLRNASPEVRQTASDMIAVLTKRAS
jgi:transcriptional regulator with XRE-family HTH domain